MKSIKKIKNKIRFEHVIVAFVLLLLSINLYVTYGTVTTVVATVSEKERIVQSDGDGGVTSKYLIFTDMGVFENTDSMLQGKFNSSDYQNKIKIGNTYRFKVNGYRIPFLSTYQNILGFEEVKQK